MAKEIPLTQGKVAIVDDEDYEPLNAHTWRAVWNSRNDRVLWYATRWTRKSECYPRRQLLMHRVIANTPARMETDHVDQDGLNNQRHNLRPCTESQNKANRNRQRNNKSGFKGVFCIGRKWKAFITYQRRSQHLGMFSSPEEAACAYDTKALELFGEFAKLNFPQRSV